MSFSIHPISLVGKVKKSPTKRACIFLFGILTCICFTVSFASAVDINSCRIIDAPGTYSLTVDINNSSATKCIEIKSSNVTLEGNGHLIGGAGTSGTFGIYVYNSSEGLDNIVIRNLRIRNWETGIDFANVTIGANGLAAN